jgi:hypothetical protein
MIPESALKQFEQNNNKQAISGFMAYTASFPRIHSLQLISTWRKHTSLKGLETKSIPNYEYVIGQPRSELEQSLARLSQVLLKNNDNAKAIPYCFVLKMKLTFLKIKCLHNLI